MSGVSKEPAMRRIILAAVQHGRQRRRRSEGRGGAQQRAPLEAVSVERDRHGGKGLGDEIAGNMPLTMRLTKNVWMKRLSKIGGPGTNELR
jgi:hypothetical protein